MSETSPTPSPPTPGPAEAATSRGVPAARPRLRGWLHAAALPVAVAGGWALTTSAAGGDQWGRGSAGVFAFFLVGLYATSSLYHVPRWGVRVRHVLSRIDVAMIQLFIAATFTPIGYHALSGAWRTWSLVLAWVLAGTGAIVAASPLRAPRWAPRWLGTAGYLAVGWLLVVPFTLVIQRLPWQGSSLIVLGGLLYTLGGIVYARRRPDPFPRWFGFHEVFHLLVVAGSTTHYLAIWGYVLP